MKCPKCGGEMEEGIIEDRNYIMTLQQVWTDKIKHFTLTGDKSERKVVTSRCKSCGYLESYAK